MPFNPAPSTFRCPFCRGEECIHFIGWTTDRKQLITAFDDQLRGLVPIGSECVETGVTIRVFHRLGRVGLGQRCLAGGVPNLDSGGEGPT